MEDKLLVDLNLVITLLSFITILLSFSIFQIVKAKSILFIMFAMILGFINRLLIYFSVDLVISRVLSIVFWSFWIVGLFNLLKLLKKYTNQENGGAWNAIKKWLGLK